jgi:hypothetical protein
MVYDKIQLVGYLQGVCIVVLVKTVPVYEMRNINGR